MSILELENRCAVIRTVGANPTLFAKRPINLNKINGRWGVTHKLTHNGLFAEDAGSAKAPRLRRSKQHLLKKVGLTRGHTVPAYVASRGL